MKAVKNFDYITMDEVLNLCNDMDVFYTNKEWIEKNGCEQPLKDNFSKETLELFAKFDNYINPFMNKEILLKDLESIDDATSVIFNPNANEIYLYIRPDLKFKFRRYTEQKEYLLVFECKIKRYDNIYEITHYISNLGNSFTISIEREKFRVHFTYGDEPEYFITFLKEVINQIEEEFIQKITIKNFNKEEDMEKFDDIKVYKRKK